jgi:hypothetical protein
LTGKDNKDKDKGSHRRCLHRLNQEQEQEQEQEQGGG